MCIKHVPATKDYSQARVGRTVTQLMAVKSGETQSHGGVVSVAVEFPKLDSSNFCEKSNLKTLKREIQG